MGARWTPGGDGRTSFLERQRAMLENMLRDLRGMERTNRLLGALLESQAELREAGTQLVFADDALEMVAELRRLAEELQKESRTNYLLACRGAEFARFSLAMLGEAIENPAADDAHALDHPA
jgi:hypothetical protein